MSSKKLKALKLAAKKEDAEYADEAVKIAFQEISHATEKQVKKLQKEIDELKQSHADLAQQISAIKNDTADADPRYVLTKKNLVNLWRRLEEEGQI